MVLEFPWNIFKVFMIIFTVSNFKSYFWYSLLSLAYSEAHQISKMERFAKIIRGDTHMTSTFKWGGRLRQKWDIIGCRGWGVASIMDVQSLFFFIKENWICAMTRHHAESNINILLTRNLPTDSGVRKWSIPLMMHCLCSKSNNRTPGQFEHDVTWFCFCFDVVRSHARCGCCSIIFWRRWKRVRLKLDIQGQGYGKMLDVDGQGGWGVLKIRQFSWTSYVHHPLTDKSLELFSQKRSLLDINVL